MLQYWSKSYEGIWHLPQDGGSCNTLMSLHDGLLEGPSSTSSGERCCYPGIAGRWTPKPGHTCWPKFHVLRRTAQTTLVPLSSDNLESCTWHMAWQSILKQLKINIERICKVRKTKSICPTSIFHNLYYITWEKMHCFFKYPLKVCWWSSFVWLILLSLPHLCNSIAHITLMSKLLR